MKFKTTGKELKSNYAYIMRVSYCGVYYLTRFIDPIAYNCGVYGWNYDVYSVNGVAIVTGYRPNIGESFIGYSRYEAKADKIYHDSTLTYEQKRKKINNLLLKLVEEFKEG